MVELSDRERQALMLSARAASREVGRALHLGGLVSADYRKLGVRNRTEVRRAAKGAIG
jgi:DNA-binding CsgD family transcriptional regulator